MTDKINVAIRAWPVANTTAKPTHQKQKKKLSMRQKWRESVLIFDVETTVDAAQSLTFGFYRFGVWRENATLDIRQEGILYADDLEQTDPAGFALLKSYARSHPQACSGTAKRLEFRTHRNFNDYVLAKAIKQNSLICGFNLSFDLSRIAYDVGEARNKNEGGFSFVMFQYRDYTTGEWRENTFLPRVMVKHVSNKFAFMRALPAGGDSTGRTKRGTIYHPGFLDLRTLAFGLADKGYTLDGACRDFGVENGKMHVEEHGKITPEYIDYARQDVNVTGLLLDALRREYDIHPIDLDPCKVHSPATIAKAYFRALGIAPRLALQPDFPPEYIGFCLSSYFGGRVETAIRNTVLPIVQTDVLSMYPSCNVNLQLWRYHIAEHVEIEECTSEAQALLDTFTPDSALDKATWPQMCWFGLTTPNGDVLPVRGKFTRETFNIAVTNYSDPEPCWYAGPDLAASKLLTGKAPKVVRAFRLAPVGQQATLQPVKLAGVVPVDPATDDFFRHVIEQRKAVKDDLSRPAPERDRAQKALKCLATSGAYGVTVEMNADESDEPVTLTVYSGDTYETKTTKPEKPGQFAFPPLASLITAGARLGLAIIEQMIADLGGHWVFCDTDSAAIVATETGGLVACPGGEYRLADDTEAIKALSWADVDAIVKRFDALNPYDRSLVRDTALKIEDVNYEHSDKRNPRRQVYALSVASKRYALMTFDGDEPVILPESKRHGLGFLMNPTEPDHDKDRAEPWECELWSNAVQELRGKPTKLFPWMQRMAVMRHTVSTPELLRAFDNWNAGKPYQQQIKPFGFMLSATLTAFGNPYGAGSDKRFLPVAPFETDPRVWHTLDWRNRYDGKPCRVFTPDVVDIESGDARVKHLAGIVAAYPYHPEAKRLGPDGLPCGKRTRGLLSRRPVAPLIRSCIGKEINTKYDESLTTTEDEVYTTFHHPDDQWSHIIPLLPEKFPDPKQLAIRIGCSVDYARRVIAGTRRPGKRNQRLILRGMSDRVNAKPRRCPCGIEFVPDDPRDVYHSEQCRRKYEKRRERARRKQPAALAAD